MTYEWEKKITQDMLDKIDAILPRGISLLGLAVVRHGSAEGAFIRDEKYQADEMSSFDVWHDAKADMLSVVDTVGEEYDRRFNKPRPNKTA